MSSDGNRGDVLVLGRGTRAFLAVIRSLGRAGLNVHAGGCAQDDLALKSRYVSSYHSLPSYTQNASGWLDTVTAVLESTKSSLVIPCNDSNLIPVQLHKDWLATKSGVYALDDRAYEVAFDKIASHLLAVELGINVPTGRVVSCDAELETVLDGLTLPVVLKPPASFSESDLGSKRTVFRARTRGDVERHLRKVSPTWGKALIEENFIGTGVGVEVLAHRGEILFAFQHVRVHEPLEGGGSSYRKSVPLDAELLAASTALMKSLEYTGVAMVEFRFNFQTGEWVFIEINGRFWGSLPLSLAAGADFPLYLYQMLVEKQTTFSQEYARNVYCRNISSDARWMAANLTADRSDVLLATRPLGAVACEVANILTFREHWDSLTIDDPRPGLVELVRLVSGGFDSLFSRLRRKVLQSRWGRRRAAARLSSAMRKARTVLFVCKGNICRSPFAARYATEVLPGNMVALSCGYYRASGRSSPKEAVHVAEGFDVDLQDHRSVIIDDDLVRQADVIVVFDEQNRRTVLRMFPDAARRVFSLGVALPSGSPYIVDPYGGGVSAFEVAYGKISQAIDNLAPTFTESVSRPSNRHSLTTASPTQNAAD